MAVVLQTEQNPTFFITAASPDIDNVTFNYTAEAPTMPNESSSPLKELHKHVSSAALYDSAERGDAPKCHEDTRIAVREEILSWITHEDRDTRRKKILWLSGPAGAGKTAIMGTVAEACSQRGELAASFFFSSFSALEDRRSKTSFVATLAYQLQRHPSLKTVGNRMMEAIAGNPMVFRFRLQEQFETLILGPLREAPKAEHSSYPKAILIDALDECGGDGNQSKEGHQWEILQTLERASLNPAFPFRIVLASRPEYIFRRFFTTPRAEGLTVQLFLDDKHDPDTDIALFLKAKFSEMARRYNLPPSWPGDDIIKLLVRRGSGQFIYAATIVRSMQTTDEPLQVQLRRIVGAGNSNPWGGMDSLYANILKSSSDPLLVVNWIKAHEQLISLKCANASTIKGFLEAFPGQAERIFAKVTPLVAICPPGDPILISPYHTSLFDFLNDPERCASLYVRSTKSFSVECILRTLNQKGPITPRPADYDEQLYLSFFFRAVPLCLDPKGDRWGLISNIQDSETSLATCDVEWWVDKSLASDEGMDFLRLMLQTVHVQCSIYHHTPMCTRWTQGVIQGLAEHPNAGLRILGRKLPPFIAKLGPRWSRMYLTVGNGKLRS